MDYQYIVLYNLIDFCNSRENEIRYEDSVEIIYGFIQSIKPINDYGDWLRTHNRYTDEYVPLFCDLSEEENNENDKKLMDKILRDKGYIQ